MEPLSDDYYTPSTFRWSIWTGEQKWALWNRQTLCNHAKAPSILEHWSKQQKTPNSKIRSITWEACDQAIRQLGLNQALWVPKWLAGFAPVGKVLQRNKYQDHAECPRCMEYKMTQHILLCKAPNAQRQWDSSITLLV